MKKFPRDFFFNYFLQRALFVHAIKRDNILRANARYHSKN